jgi:hypothetical protein
MRDTEAAGVLPNASSQARIDSIDWLAQNGVLAHFAWLVLGADQVPGGIPANFVPFEDTYMLNPNTFPATLTIDNPGNLPQENIAQCLPSLSHWIPDAGPGDPVTHANPDEVSCYFDSQNGVLNGASVDQGAGVGNLMMVTIGNPVSGSPPSTARTRPSSHCKRPRGPAPRLASSSSTLPPTRRATVNTTSCSTTSSPTSSRPTPGGSQHHPRDRLPASGSQSAQGLQTAPAAYSRPGVFQLRDSVGAGGVSAF